MYSGKKKKIRIVLMDLRIHNEHGYREQSGHPRWENIISKHASNLRAPYSIIGREVLERDNIFSVVGVWNLEGSGTG